MSQLHYQFNSIAQPIVSKRECNIYAMEILSAAIQRFDAKLLSHSPSTYEPMLFICNQLKLIDKAPKNVKFNINAINELISDVYFLNELENIDTSKLAIEIDYFTPDLKKIDELIKIIHHVKSLGSEIWLDDYRPNEHSNLLLSIPWTGVKINKEVVWNEMDKHSALEQTIQDCKRCNLLVTLDGIDNMFIYDLVKSMPADFFQGYYWPPEKL
ncbi:MAG: EAL domain-containing protein [Plesiomonas shigelloides]